ncbi:hypothetical protein GH733_008620 [Mirounga leonina]|nr:hypothetical protein GH733_008620 [Mirounga leonina]
MTPYIRTKEQEMTYNSQVRVLAGYGDNGLGVRVCALVAAVVLAQYMFTLKRRIQKKIKIIEMDFESKK